MNETAAEAFLAMVAGRQGHFLLESGHHTELWLDLDALFAEPRRVAPLIAAMAAGGMPTLRLRRTTGSGIPAAW